MKVLVCNPEEAEVVGHHASIVLSQIRYWLYKAKNGENRYVVSRAGERWLAHSRDQLCEETRLSPRQIRDALATLKKFNFLRVEQHLFQGKNVSHFQAASDGRLVDESTTNVAQEVRPATDQPVQPELDSSVQLIKEENNLETEGEYGATNAPISFSVKKKEGEEGEEEEEEGGRHACATKPLELSCIFRDAWNDAHPNLYLADFDAKAMGQFKNLLHRCPVGEAAAVVQYCVGHWDQFCSYAINQEGAFRLPVLPRVGSLLCFVGSAVRLYRDHRDVVTKPAAKRTRPPAPARLPELGGDKPMSLEEVAKVLGKQL